jgi:hypothetical protein
MVMRVDQAAAGHLELADQLQVTPLGDLEQLPTPPWGRGRC